MDAQAVGIDEVVESIRILRDARTPVLVGIDGAGGSGKSTLASALAEHLGGELVVVPMDDFIVRERMLDDSWEHGWGRERLIRQVLEPLRSRVPVVYQRLEWNSNTLSEPIAVEVAPIIVIEGITALHSELAPYWDLTIWVETDPDIARERGRSRDAGTENAQHWDRWARNDSLYRTTSSPHERAALVVRAGF